VARTPEPARDGSTGSLPGERVIERPSVGASVDLGSNSVHLLVAAIAGHELRPLVDESSFLGLGKAVDQRAHLGGEARAELATTLAAYAATAQALGATTITFMGTEPIRRAADAGRIVDEVDRASGVPLHVLTHEEEAYLTLVGVTAGMPVRHETLVVDIGGGSSEFCAVAAGGVARAAGLRLGSNRLTTRHGGDDPPTSGQVQAMRSAAGEILAEALPAEPAELVAVGGTASNLLKVTAGGVADRVVTEARIGEALHNLSGATAAEVATRYGVNPKRTPLLTAGVVIVEALMLRYGVEEVRVSDAGMREGAILVADHAGRAWRDRLAELAHGWRR
jgi:exopolyphosphatase / guanosine-5'-triphosphate,3'-diphosphate pyrophosphatase